MVATETARVFPEVVFQSPYPAIAAPDPVPVPFARAPATALQIRIGVTPHCPFRNSAISVAVMARRAQHRVAVGCQSVNCDGRRPAVRTSTTQLKLYG